MWWLKQIYDLTVFVGHGLAESFAQGLIRLNSKVSTRAVISAEAQDALPDSLVPHVYRTEVPLSDWVSARVHSQLLEVTM